MAAIQTNLLEKLNEALKAVLPIMGIVLILSFTIAPLPSGILLLFLFGGILLILGMMFFNLGAELSMTPMGEKVGKKMAGSMHLGLVLFLCFLLGFIITISEPDLQVLAGQVPSIPESDADPCRGRRRWALSDDCRPPNAFFHGTCSAAHRLLSVCVYPGFLCSRRFSCCRL